MTGEKEEIEKLKKKLFELEKQNTLLINTIESANQQLKGNTDILNIIQSASKIGSLLADLKTMKLTLSPEFCKIYEIENNLSIEEFNKISTQRIHLDDFQIAYEQNKKFITGKIENYHSEFRLIFPDGKIKWIFCQGKILEKEDEKITKFAVIILDITERKKYKKEIRLHNERLESLLTLAQLKDASIENILDNSMEIALKITGSSIGIIYQYSEETKEMELYSWSKNVMAECNLREKKSEHIPREDRIWKTLIIDKKPITINNYKNTDQLKKACPDGHIEILKFMAIPVMINNKLVAIFGVANKNEDYDETDINQLMLLANSTWSICEIKKDEEILRNNSCKLKELNESKDKFFSIIAHDLKNPFSNILGFSDLLMKNFDTYPTEKSKSFIQHINSSAKITYDLLQNLLLWANTQWGKTESHQEFLSLNNLFDDLKILYNDTAQKKNIYINFPSTTTDITIFADINLITCILRNLLSNAIKYTQKGGKIELTAIHSNMETTISISDNGVGMDDQCIANFYTPHTFSSKIGTANESGTGLGLKICIEFIEKMGGKLQIESILGKGSKFTFTIPDKKE